MKDQNSLSIPAISPNQVPHISLESAFSLSSIQTLPKVYNTMLSDEMIEGLTSNHPLYTGCLTKGESSLPIVDGKRSKFMHFLCFFLFQEKRCAYLKRILNFFHGDWLGLTTFQTV